eukprot:gene14661-biopygen6596
MTIEHWKKRQRARTGRGPDAGHHSIQRNGRGPDADRTRAAPFLPGAPKWDPFIPLNHIPRFIGVHLM